MIGKIRGREAGMSFWPFVVALVLVLVAVVFWYDGTKDHEKTKQDLATKAAEAQSWKDRFGEANKKLIALVDVTGYPDAASHPDAEKLQTELVGFADKWREKATIEFDNDRYTATGAGGAVEKLQGNRIRVTYLPLKGEVTTLSVETLLPMLESAANRMQVDIKRAFESAYASAAEVATLKTKQAAELAAKDAKNSADSAAAAAANAAATERERELRDQLTAKDAAVTQAQTELEALRAKATETEARLTREVSQKSAEIGTLVRRDAPAVSEGPDGEVLAAGSGIAVVNRGKQHMLMPGTTFTVLGRRKGGDLVTKGVLHVTLVNETTAEARVVDEVANDPIGKGDLVQSAIYSPNRQLRFVLLGDFRKMGRSQAEARLKSLGAAVDANVSSLTHYLVVGGGENLEESEAYRRAKEFQVTILTEEALSSFTMY